MKINKLRIKNMYGVKGDVEYDLSPRIVGLFGKNGAGKSSVINSLKLAIGGEKTSSAMLRGVDNSAVRIQTDTVTIDRQLKKTETGSVMTGWIDGKKTPGNRIQIDLASRLETTKDNLKILSSKDIEKSLAENAGKILLSFADDELTSSEVKELLTKEAGETTDFNKEDINKVRFPDHIMWQDAESIASEYKKKTSGLRAEIKGMEATYSSIHLADLGNAEIPSAEEAKEEYDTLIKKEALYTEGQKLLKNYERMNVTRETTLKSIQEKLEEVAKLGEVRSLDVVKAEKNQLFEKRHFFFSLYLQSASPCPRKTGMEARNLGRVRLHGFFLLHINEVQGFPCILYPFSLPGALSVPGNFSRTEMFFLSHIPNVNKIFEMKGDM